MTPKEKYQDIDLSKLPEKAVERVKFYKAYYEDDKPYADDENKARGELGLSQLYDAIAQKYPEALKSKQAKPAEPTPKPNTQPEPAKKPAAKKPSKPAAKKSSTAKPKPAAKPTKRGDISHLAKEIRKDGERWQDAVKRAGEMIQAEKKKASDKQSKQLNTFLKKNQISAGSTTISRDATRKALPAGKRTSKNGNTYYEYRQNRTDKHRKRYPYLALGGKLHGAGMFEGGGKYAKGGDIEGHRHTLHIDGQNWFLEKIDSTHFYMSNDRNHRGMAHHIGQHKGEPYYEEVKEWLKTTYAKGGELKIYYAIVDENTDRIYVRNSDKTFIYKKYKELKEIYPNDKLSIVEFPSKMAKGGELDINKYAGAGMFAGGGKTNEKLDLLENELTAAGIYVQRLLDMEKVPYLTIFTKSDPILENNFFFINKSGKYEMGNHYWEGDSEKAHIFNNIESIMKYVRSENFKTIADKQMEGNYAKGGEMAAGGNMARPLYEIAQEIRKDWRPVYFGAKPYLDAMSSMDSVNDNYGFDSGRSIVNYFLANAQSWRGDTAKRIKAELKSMLKYAKGGRMNYLFPQKNTGSSLLFDLEYGDVFEITRPNHTATHQYFVFLELSDAYNVSLKVRRFPALKDDFGNKETYITGVSDGDIRILSREEAGKKLLEYQIKNEKFAKGGKTKKKSKVVRGYFDDEPYEYAAGGKILNPKNHGNSITLPQGKYYIGDLCYVIGDEWDNLLDYTAVYDVNGKLVEYQDGFYEWTTNNGTPMTFGWHGTAHGDGSYSSNIRGNVNGASVVGVDSGTIGIVSIDSLEKAGFLFGSLKNALMQGGYGIIHEFDRPFVVYLEENPSFGEIHIQTEHDDDNNNDDWGYDDNENYNNEEDEYAKGGFIDRTKNKNKASITADFNNDFWVLETIFREKRNYLSGISQYLGIDKSLVKEKLDALVKKGWVRVEENTAEPHLNQYYVTEKGKNEYSKDKYWSYDIIKNKVERYKNGELVDIVDVYDFNIYMNGAFRKTSGSHYDSREEATQRAEEVIDLLQDVNYKEPRFGLFAKGGHMAKGGYTTKGEDYEYVNTFKRFDSNVPVPQEDFEKLVDAYHKQLSNDKLDIVKYNILKLQMGNYLGHKTIDEIEQYILKTHQAHEHSAEYAKGGELNNLMPHSKTHKTHEK